MMVPAPPHKPLRNFDFDFDFDRNTGRQVHSLPDFIIQKKSWIAALPASKPKSKSKSGSG